MSIGRRLFNLLLVIDQAVFCLLTLGASWPDEAPSAAAWRLESEGRWIGRFWRPVLDWVFAHLPFGLSESDHCQRAFWAEVHGHHLHPTYRNARLYLDRSGKDTLAR